MMKRKLWWRVAREGWPRALPVKEGWAAQKSVGMACHTEGEQGQQQKRTLEEKKKKKKCIDEKPVSGEEHTIG